MFTLDQDALDVYFALVFFALLSSCVVAWWLGRKDR